MVAVSLKKENGGFGGVVFGVWSGGVGGLRGGVRGFRGFFQAEDGIRDVER